jgi:hypothetical protein
VSQNVEQISSSALGLIADIETNFPFASEQFRGSGSGDGICSSRQGWIRAL